MGYQCLPQMTGLVRGTPPQGSKHRANGKKILQELGRERYSRSVTLERERSLSNVYDGYKGSGGRCWDAMERDANDYRIVGEYQTGKRKGEIFSRSLRSDAVIGWSVIVNPPHDMTVDWDESTFQKFYEDSFAILEELQPKLFRSDNIRMTAKHRDEGVSADDEHMHIVGDAIDPEGRYCGNLIDASLYALINERYPAMMRERGWAIDDCDRTDFARCAVDDGYRQERNRKRHQTGRSVSKYVADKRRSATSMLEDAQKAAEAIIQAANARAEEIHQNAEKDALRASKAILERARADADRMMEDAAGDADRIRQYVAISRKIASRMTDNHEKQQPTTAPLPKIYRNLDNTKKSDKYYQEAMAALGDVIDGYPDNSTDFSKN